jgi:hypothetical protein
LHVLKAKYKNPETLLERLQPDIALMPPSELGNLDQQKPPTVSAFVDDDVYRVAQRFMNGEGWCDSPPARRRSGDQLKEKTQA